MLVIFECLCNDEVYSITYCMVEKCMYFFPAHFFFSLSSKPKHFRNSKIWIRSLIYLRTICYAEFFFLFVPTDLKLFWICHIVCLIGSVAAINRMFLRQILAVDFLFINSFFTILHFISLSE